MIKYRIRVSDQWYGDYMAQVGALRVAERRLTEMCDKYGVDILRTFVDRWQEYGKERMIAEIKRLPKGEWEGQVTHDPIPNLIPEGITIKAKVAIDPDEGMIEVDVRDNPENIPCGFNLSEAATYGSVITGLLFNMDSTVPHNDGAFSRIKIHMREGCLVGKPTFPMGTSVCTTNVCDRLITLVASIMAQLGHGYGMAEGPSSLTAGSSVVSGTDWRRGGAPYINFLAFPPCGPAMYKHDGWLTFAVSAAAGVVFLDSVEIDERKVPLIFEKNELAMDSSGPGEWDGAPATDVVFGARKDPVTVLLGDRREDLSRKGGQGRHGRQTVRGLQDRPCDGKERRNAFCSDHDPARRGAPFFRKVPAGAGYGDPLDRDPDLVRLRAREGWISLERAREIYGVVLDATPEEYAVDPERTKELRARLRKERDRT